MDLLLLQCILWKGILSRGKWQYTEVVKWSVMRCNAVLRIHKDV